MLNQFNDTTLPRDPWFTVLSQSTCSLDNLHCRYFLLLRSFVLPRLCTSLSDSLLLLFPSRSLISRRDPFRGRVSNGSFLRVQPVFTGLWSLKWYGSITDPRRTLHTPELRLRHRPGFPWRQPPIVHWREECRLTVQEKNYPLDPARISTSGQWVTGSRLYPWIRIVVTETEGYTLPVVIVVVGEDRKKSKEDTPEEILVKWEKSHLTNNR